MAINRREFLGALAGLGLSGKLFSQSEADIKTAKTFYKPELGKFFEHSGGIVLPPGLKKGSRVAISSPASAVSLWELRHSRRALSRMGLITEIGGTIRYHDTKYRYLSAPDKQRAEEFMNFIVRDDIDAVIAGRGGYGVMRILPMLDFDTIRRHPKIIMGYSDITALLNAVYNLSGVVTYHGPVGNSTFNSFTVSQMKKVIFSKESFEPKKEKYTRMMVINKGKARGKLTGGNLSMVAASMGTPYETDTRGSILFLEEVSEEPYKIDKMLTQLWLDGKLQECAGIAFGYIKNLNTRKNFYPGRSFTVKQVIEDRLKPLGIPACINLPFGHLENKMTLPIGVEAELDTENQTFTILNRAVS